MSDPVLKGGSIRTVLAHDHPVRAMVISMYDYMRKTNPHLPPLDPEAAIEINQQFAQDEKNPMLFRELTTAFIEGATILRIPSAIIDR